MPPWCPLTVSQVVQNATMVTDEEGNSVALYDEPNATVWMVVGTAGRD